MLLKSVQKVNDLDDKIRKLHQELVSLYSERSRLMSTPVQTESRIYDELAAGWSLPVKLSSLSTLRADLVKAQSIVDRIQSISKVNVRVVAVPPRSVLLKLINDYELASVSSDEAQLDELLPATRKWSLLVMPTTPVAVDIGMSVPADKAITKLAGFDARGLGIAELLALQIQGVPVLRTGQWTLLGGQSAQRVLTATLNADDSISLAYDDGRALLGDNYFYQVVKV